MLLLLQLTVNGLVIGALYALMTLGFAVIYNGTRLFHLAHGAVFTSGAYGLWGFYTALHLNLIVSFVLAIACASIFGILMEVLVYRPLVARRSESAAIVIASLGLITAAQATYGLTFGTETLPLRPGALPTFQFGAIVITQLKVVDAIVVLIILPLLHFFISYTPYGRAIRALADNPDLSQLFGIDTNRFNILIFGLGSALAAIAGGLIALDVGVRPDMGFDVMFIALTAIIIGGVGYLPGAAAGGLIVGLLQNLALWPLSGEWQNVVVFGVLILFLLFRPQGVFGRVLVIRRA